jgi:hypothetical protein
VKRDSMYASFRTGISVIKTESEQNYGYETYWEETHD